MFCSSQNTGDSCQHQAERRVSSNVTEWLSGIHGQEDGLYVVWVWDVDDGFIVWAVWVHTVLWILAETTRQ